MMGFHGWSPTALEFFNGLEADNSKSYWQAHRAIYDEQVRGPMVELLAELHDEFGVSKIYRPNRDVRFSPDKSPYKTHIGATLDNTGYVHLSADGPAAGSGAYIFAPDQLARYRRAVLEDLPGERLQRVADELQTLGIKVTAAATLVSAPRGVPRDHPRIALLRLKGLTTWREWPTEPWLGTAACKEHFLGVLRASVPLTEWMHKHVGPSELPREERRG